MQLYKIKELAAKVPKERKKGWWKKWLVVIPLFSAVASLIYIVNLPEYQIETIKVIGAGFTDRELVTGRIQELLDERYAMIVPKSNVWIYPRRVMRDELEALPAVLEADVNVDRSNRSLSISLTERKHEYVWCVSDSTSCYYMDRDGLVFAEAPTFEGSAFLRFFGQIASKDPINKKYLEPETMADLTGFIESVKDLGLRPSEVRVINLREAHITLQSGTDLIVSLEKSLKGIVDNMRAILATPEFLKQIVSVDRLSYIDLRYGSKVYWKEK